MTFNPITRLLHMREQEELIGIDRSF